MLQRSTGEKIRLSQEEIQTILGPHPGTPGWKNPELPFTGRYIIFFADPDKYVGFPKSVNEIEGVLSHCNNNKWHDRQRTGIYLDAATQCGKLGIWLINSSGLRYPEAEVAFQRACALPELRTAITDIAGPCSMLGDFYRDRGQLDLALAVYLHAPNCDLNIFNSTFALGEACRQGAVDVYAARNDKRDEQELLGSLCHEYGDKWSDDCQLYKQNGGSVDLDAVEAAASQFHQALNAQIEQANEAATERQREHDANFNAIVGALQSLPGANDPNAIVDAANQRAANITAVGAANGAAHAQGATQRAVAQQPELPNQQTQSAANFAGTSGGNRNQSSSTASSASAEFFCSDCIAPPPAFATCIHDIGVDSTFHSYHLFRNTCGETLFVLVAGRQHGVTPIFHFAPGSQESGGDAEDPYRLFVCPDGKSPVGVGDKDAGYDTVHYECGTGVYSQAK
jgi:hypothetical protein